MINSKQDRSLERGFSLFELAISLIIIGVLMGSFGMMYQLYKVREARDLSQENIKSVASALADYRRNFGRYPYPASLSAPRGNEFYGIEHPDELTAGGPTIQALAIGECDLDADGDFDLCVEESAANPLDTAGLVNKRVYRGAIPFKTLNIPEHESYDGYGSKLFYVVTEVQTEALSASALNGGILIVDNQATPESIRVDDAGNAAYFPYLLFSAGENKLGAFNKWGNITNPCAGTSVDVENCNTIADSTATYASTTPSYTNDANEYDDFMSYFMETEFRYWARATNNVDIHSVGADDLAFGHASAPGFDVDMGAATDVQIRAQSDAAAPDTSRVMAPSFCEESDAACNQALETSFIAGAQFIDRDGDTVADDPNYFVCPSGTFAKVFEKNTVSGLEQGIVCESIDSIGCDPGEVIASIIKNADGTATAVCTEPPPESCPATDKYECEEFLPIAEGVHGDEATLTFGDSRKFTYQCDDGNWVKKSGVSGFCKCDDKWETRKCPSGFNKGEEKWVDRCVSGYRDGNYELYSSSCECQDGTWQEIPNSCGSGLNRVQTGYTQFSCSAGGSTSPGSVITVQAQQCQCAGTGPKIENLCKASWESGFKLKTSWNECDLSDLSKPAEYKEIIVGSCSCVPLADKTNGPRTCQQWPLKRPKSYKGEQHIKRVFSCDTKKYGSWEVDWDKTTCACDEDFEQSATRSCKDAKHIGGPTYHSGYTGTYEAKRKYNCGTDAYTAWEVETNTCTCTDGAIQNVQVNCSKAGFPSSYIGNIDEERAYQCSGNKYVATGNYSNSTCRPPPKDICSYEPDANQSWVDGYGGLINANSSCSCGDKGDVKKCNTTKDGDGVHKDCICKVTGQESFPFESWPYSP